MATIRTRYDAVGARIPAGALRIGSAVGHAIARPRELGFGEGRVIAAAGLLLVALGAIAFQWPRAVAWPFAAFVVWIGLAILVHAWRGYRAVRRAAKDRRERDAVDSQP